jgi:hypothetical protein
MGATAGIGKAPNLLVTNRPLRTAFRQDVSVAIEMFMTLRSSPN